MAKPTKQKTDRTPIQVGVFDYDACPTHADGLKRAVTVEGQEVILLSNKAKGDWPIIGQYPGENCVNAWDVKGVSPRGTADSLIVCAPPKRIVWVNLYDKRLSNVCDSEDEAAVDAERMERSVGLKRIGGRAYPIEIEATS